MMSTPVELNDHEIATREDQFRAQGATAAALGAADWVCLAATPTFAVMALVAALLGGGGRDLLCSAAQGASPLNAMATMYLLMSVFHCAPWLKLAANWKPPWR